MTVRLVVLGGSDWSDGEILYAADQNDTLEAIHDKNWAKYFYSVDANSAGTFALHSTTKMSAGQGNNLYQITVDLANRTLDWSAAKVAGGAGHEMYVCEGTITRAISREYNGADMQFTTDSGDNWAEANADPTITTVYTAAYPTSGIALCGGVSGAAVSCIAKSTDGGNNWAEVMGGGGELDEKTCWWMTMVDGSNGIANVEGTLWYTTDGGDNWTDTTTVMTSEIRGNPHVITWTTSSDFKFVIIGAQSYGTGTDSNNPLHIWHCAEDVADSQATERFYMSEVTSVFASKIVKATNGNYYCIVRDGSHLILLKSSDGIVWESRILPYIKAAGASGANTLIEHPSTPNVLLYSSNGLVGMVEITV